MASPTSHAAEPMPAWPPHGRERLVGTDLHLAGLSATRLPGADFRRAHLREAWLRESCLHAGDLDGADLRGAKLDGRPTQRDVLTADGVAGWLRSGGCRRQARGQAHMMASPVPPNGGSGQRCRCRAGCEFCGLYAVVAEDGTLD